MPKRFPRNAQKLPSLHHIFSTLPPGQKTLFTWGVIHLFLGIMLWAKGQWNDSIGGSSMSSRQLVEIVTCNVSIDILSFNLHINLFISLDRVCIPGNF
jgi:hypothetical protein